MNRRAFFKTLLTGLGALTIPKFLLAEFYKPYQELVITGVEPDDYVTVVDIDGKSLEELYYDTKWNTRRFRVPDYVVDEKVQIKVRRLGDSYNIKPFT